MSTINGLKLDKIKSSVESAKSPLEIADWNELNKQIAPHFISQQNIRFVAYLDYKVAIGKFDNNLILPDGETFDPKHIQKLRVFSNDKELYLWRKKPNTFGYRLRIDHEGEEQDVVDACQALWGTDVENPANGWIRLFEKRGVELTVPFDLKNFPKQGNTEPILWLHTRNYVGYINNELQAGYVDCRFVAFSDNNNLGE